jgi:hypothetical protein
MRRLILFVVAVAAVAAAPAAANPTPWTHIEVGPMKTSIYVGRVTLTTGNLARSGLTLAADYKAEVFPWFFWGESGQLTITLKDGDLARIARGETVEFTGDATNQKHKPRSVSGRAQPADATTGKIKIRIKADGYELIFNGTYRLGGD